MDAYTYVFRGGGSFLRNKRTSLLFPFGCQQVEPTTTTICPPFAPFKVSLKNRHGGGCLSDRVDGSKYGSNPHRVSPIHIYNKLFIYQELNKRPQGFGVTEQNSQFQPQKSLPCVAFSPRAPLCDVRCACPSAVLRPCVRCFLPCADPTEGVRSDEGEGVRRRPRCKRPTPTGAVKNKKMLKK